MANVRLELGGNKPKHVRGGWVDRQCMYYTYVREPNVSSHKLRSLVDAAPRVRIYDVNVDEIEMKITRGGKLWKGSRV